MRLHRLSKIVPAGGAEKKSLTRSFTKGLKRVFTRRGTNKVGQGAASESKHDSTVAPSRGGPSKTSHKRVRKQKKPSVIRMLSSFTAELKTPVVKVKRLKTKRRTNKHMARVRSALYVYVFVPVASMQW